MYTRLIKASEKDNYKLARAKGEWQITNGEKPKKSSVKVMEQ